MSASKNVAQCITNDIERMIDLKLTLSQKCDTINTRMQLSDSLDEVRKHLLYHVERMLDF